MNQLTHISADHPHVAEAVPVLARVLFQRLTDEHPMFAQSFSSLFTYREQDAVHAIVAVGELLSVEGFTEGNRLTFELKRHGEIELAAEFPMDGQDFYEAAFEALARFWDKVQIELNARYGLGKDATFLGGWQCLTHAHDGRKSFVRFIFPEISFQLSPQKAQVTMHGDPLNRMQVKDLLALPTTRSALGPVGVLSCQNFPEQNTYLTQLEQLIAELKDQNKVVIGRKVVLTLDQTIRPVDLLQRVVPEALQNYEFIFQWRGQEAWVGISPETLLKTTASFVVVEPLAGTRRGADEEAKRQRYHDELVNDAKEIEEHNTAAFMFLEQLQKVCLPESIRLEELRSVINLGYVQHLKSRLTGVAKAGLNTFDLLSALYPPATIWGKPIAESLRLMKEFESIDRDYFTGAFGFLTLEKGDANFALAIRLSKLEGRELHVYAGSGIVRGSSPDREWLETTSKMSPFLQNPYFNKPHNLKS